GRSKMFWARNYSSELTAGSPSRLPEKLCLIKRESCWRKLQKSEESPVRLRNHWRAPYVWAPSQPLGPICCRTCSRLCAKGTRNSICSCERGLPSNYLVNSGLVTWTPSSHRTRLSTRRFG